MANRMRGAAKNATVLGIAALVVGLYWGAGSSAARAETEALSGAEKFKEAWELYRTGQPADDAFQEILDDENAPKNDRFNSAYVLGVIALGRKDNSAALAQLERAERLLAGRPQVKVRRAEAYLADKMVKEAAKELKEAKPKVKKGTPLFARYHIAMARLEEATSGAEKAAAYLEEVAKVCRDRWDVHFTLGTLYEGLDQAKKAIAAYDAAIQADPKQDPCPAIYAYQRWAAIAISADPESYGKKELCEKAIARYKVFLQRAAINRVPDDLVNKAKEMIWVLESFGAK